MIPQRLCKDFKPIVIHFSSHTPSFHLRKFYVLYTYTYFKNWCDISIDIINLYFSGCCKTLLINWEGAGARPHTYVHQYSGTRNGHSKYSVREGGDADALYFENGKWVIGGGRGRKVGISNTSPKCPELVQSWSAGSAAIKGRTLVGGTIRCASDDQAFERCLQNVNDCNNVQI